MDRKENISIVLGICYFCYSICAALVFQKVLLPMIPSLHAGRGLLLNDSVYFDSVATQLAEKINNNGWSSWRLFPAEGAAGNIGILGGLYALFGPDPTVIIPVNSALHALSGVMIFLLAFELTPKANVAKFAGYTAATLFVIFPSALSWYGQMHKDSYAIAGALLVIFSWCKASNNIVINKNGYCLIFINLVGIILLGIVRPYALKIFLIAGSLIFLPIVLKIIVDKRFKFGNYSFFIAAILMMGGGVALLKEQNMGEQYAYASASTSRSALLAIDDWHWGDSAWLPDGLEKYIKLAAETRVGLINFGVGLGAGSMIDENIVPGNLNEAIDYIPRAIQIAALAPFPTSWFVKSSITRIITTGEMVVYYCCISGIFFLAIYNRTSSVLLALYFSLFFLAIYGFTQANLGTLYRYRYAYTAVLMLLGSIGWFSWLDMRGYLNNLVNSKKNGENLYNIYSHDDDLISGNVIRRKKTLVSAISVFGLTFIGFIGFFLRDVLMARHLGISGSLDSFFAGLIVPMFIVTVICMPLGAAIIPIYLDEREKSLESAKNLLCNVSFLVTIVLASICLVLYFCIPMMLPYFYPNLPHSQLAEISYMSALALPILLFSGLTILSNSVLNAHGKTTLTSSAQLVVPISAIIALLAFISVFGVKAVMLGMIFGQILNLVINLYYLNLQGLSLTRWSLEFNSSLSIELIKQYLPVMASALFVNIAMTVSGLLAISLSFGGFSAFNLGNKIVLFVIGMVNAVVSTVVLPYFSSLIASKKLLSARKELSFFLILITFVSVPLSAVFYIFSEHIVSFIFQNEVYESEGGKEIVSVMRYALVQIPFFVCNAILLKFAIATRHSFAVFFSAIFGLIVNVVMALILVKSMGVGGISLAVSISVVFSTLMLFFMMVKYQHIGLFDLVVVVLNWVLFIALLVSVHFYSMPSIFVIITAYFLLVAMYLFTLSGRHVGIAG